MIFGNGNVANRLRLPSPGMMDDPRTGGITGNLPGWSDVVTMTAPEAAPEVEYRQGQPFVATQGQAIPQEYYRGGQPAMMPIGGNRINWETASPAERDKALAAMQGRMQSAMKGFALPDVSKYGYSPESQGRVEGAGYLTETPFGRAGGILAGSGAAPAEGRASVPMGIDAAAPMQAGATGDQAPASPHWSVEGFDAMRQQSQPAGLLPATVGTGRPSGLFGKRKAFAFDYDAAAQSMLPQEKKPSTFMKIMQVLGPALMAAGGNQEGANAIIASFARERAERDRQRFETARTVADWRHGDYSKFTDAALKASAPFTIGRDRLIYDPETGETVPIWQGAQDWEAYAESQGLKPGTPAYFQAVEDYVLRGAGPSAMENYSGLDDHRTANDLRLEGARAGYRTSLEGLRQRGQLNLEGARAGNRASLEDKRQTGRVNLRGVPTYRDTHGTPGRSTARPTATGPDGKSKVEWDGKAWVPVK